MARYDHPLFWLWPWYGQMANRKLLEWDLPVFWITHDNGYSRRLKAGVFFNTKTFVWSKWSSELCRSASLGLLALCEMWPSFLGTSMVWDPNFCRPHGLKAASRTQVNLTHYREMCQIYFDIRLNSGCWFLVTNRWLKFFRLSIPYRFEKLIIAELVNFSYLKTRCLEI